MTGRADPVGGEPVFDDTGAPIGRVSSGAYGHSVDASIALAFLQPEHVAPGHEVEVAILGRPHVARVLAEPPFDPRGERLRA